jgi:bifunctional oligoribonuclease and PAP phosphatase NrnA
MKKYSFLNKEFDEAWGIIEKAGHVFMTTHEGTDGDDLGSLLAVRKVLLSLGKNVSIAVVKGVPQSLKYLPGSLDVKEEYSPADYDLVMTFGCSKIDRPAIDELKTIKAPILNFDHHPDNARFGTVNMVDPKTAAVAELVYYFLKHRNIATDKDIATCLLTGIFTDTGGFKHANTSAEVLEVSSELVRKGARIDRIAEFTYGQKRPQALKAWSRALENTRLDPEKEMIYSILTKEDMEELQATDEDLKGFVEILNHIPQAKFAMVLKQDGDIVRGSLRSESHKNTDVSKIAHSFGGGGHKLAAGFTIKGRLVKKENGWEVKEAKE